MKLRSPFVPIAFLAASLCSIALAAPERPFNGGFELTSMGQPLGWQVEGPWFVRGDAAAAGKNGVSLRAEYSKVGNRLCPEGYLIAGPGQTIKITLRYTSNGGPAVGLAFCDVFGSPVGEGLFEPLCPSDTWTTYERSIELTPQLCDKPYAAVRPVFRVETDGAQARLDCVVLSTTTTATPRPLVPKFKPEERPNLLVNPGLSLDPGGVLPGWKVLEAPGFRYRRGQAAAYRGDRSR